MSKRSQYPIFVTLLFTMLLMACSQKETIMTRQEIKAKADSIIATKTAELNREAAEDLDRRRSIEVKAIADSIVEAWRATQPKDSIQ